MGNQNNSHDDESQPVRPTNEAEDSQNPEKPELGKDQPKPEHGTVADIDSEVGGDVGSDNEIDATIADVDALSLQGDDALVDASAGLDGGVDSDLDATIVDIDPTVGLESDDIDESGTASGIELSSVQGDGDESDEFDPNATVADMDADSQIPGAANQTAVTEIVSGDPEADAQAEVDLDATVNEIDATFALDDNGGPDSEVDSDSDGHTEDLDKTIMEGDIDQTIVTTPEEDFADVSEQGRPANPTVVRAGGSSGKDNPDKVEVTIRDAQEATFDGYESQPSVRTVDSSVLDSEDIGQTINPREMSDEEASAWSLAAQGVPAKAGQTVESGSGPRRTWVDYQFSRLRERSVSTGKQKQNVDDDYRLVRKLGQGGMGDVYVARQGSLNRLLALKLIKPIDGERRAQLQRIGKLESVEEERRQQFLSEAIVTGDLDHPNIVPIHDVAVTSENELFYSMKRVVGTPWSKVIKENSREENLEILMKACDAIGFAHERGVVHRDIKPENIMLGDFGVVMVMDWGLALPTSSYDKHDSIFATSGLGGTPAFMAPEMVTGPLDKIGPASDIYLLGATLFMIVTGSAPHKAKTVTECLKSVRRNTIRKVSAAQQGELLNIAMRAMATKPEDRYPDVASFQNDIRAYREHAESISLTVRATEDLEQGQAEASYSALSRAAFRYEEALKSWDANERARQGLEKTKLVHAKIAYDKGDYEFGLSLLEKGKAEHLDQINELEAAIRLRDSHAARVAVLRKAALAMLAFIIVFGSAALYFINDAKNEAVAARLEEEKAKDKAIASEKDAIAAREKEEKARLKEEMARLEEKKAKEEALVSERIAVAAKEKEEKARLQEEKARLEEKKAKEKAQEAERVAVAAQMEEEKARLEEKKAKEEAVLAKQQAEEQRSRAEYEEYISKIALAKTRLERNEADGAREILLDLRSSQHSGKRTRGWEWRWLWRQANQSKALGIAESPVVDLAMDRDGRIGAVATANGQVQFITPGDRNANLQRVNLPKEVLGEKLATCVALSFDGQRLAIGTTDGSVILIRETNDVTGMAQAKILLKVHKRPVTDVCFGSDGTLWTASEDRTVRSWKPVAGGSLREVAVGWHFLPVRQIAVASDGDKTLLAAVVGDGKSGKIVVWEKVLGDDGAELKLLGRMSDHPVPPTAVTFDSEGRRVASGDFAGNVLVWNTVEVSAKGEEQFRNSIEVAVKQTLNGGLGNGATNQQPAKRVGVALQDTAEDEVRRFVSSEPSEDRSVVPAKAHGDAIETIRFSDDGDSLLTASDDYTVKLWNLEQRTIRQTLKGHGGWVVGACFIAGKDDAVISASDDATVRVWNPNTYVGAFKSQVTSADPDSILKPADAREEIWSATFAPGGQQIVIARGDHKAEVIRIDEGSLDFRQVSELSLEEGTDFVAMSMQVDRKNGLLYIGSGDETIRVWDLQRGVQIGTASKTGLNSSFAVSRDGRWMLTGSSDPKIRGVLWRLDPTGKSSPKFAHGLMGKQGQEGVSTFAIAPDSKTMFTGDDFGIGLLWDLETGQQIGGPIVNVRGSRINDAIFGKDGKTIYVAADNALVTQIDLDARQEINRLQQVGYVVDLKMSEDQQHLLTICELASEDYIKTFATFWDLEKRSGKIVDMTVTPRSRDSETISRSRITSACFDPDGKVVLVSRTANEKEKSEIRIWNLEQLKSPEGFMKAEQMKQVVMQSSRSNAGGTVFLMPSVRGDIESLAPLGSERLLTMNNNGVFLWNLKTKREERSFRAHAELTEADFSFDAKYVATASRSVKIWDAESGQALAKIESERPIRTVQFSPVKVGAAGYMFATGGDEGVVKFWSFDPGTNEVAPFADVAKEAIEVQRESTTKVIRRVRFSRDGNRLWIVGDDGLARLRDLRDATETIELSVPSEESLRCAAFSEDGSYLVAGSRGKNVMVWQLPESGRDLRLVVLSGHSGQVNDVGLIGDDAETLRVFSASQDGTIRVWDPRFSASATGEGREIISLRRHQSDVTALDTIKDGELLMTAGSGGEVILWPADPVAGNVAENP